MQRRTVAVAALAALVVMGGCLGFLSGPLTFSANKVTAQDSALEQTGYEKVTVEQQQVNRTFSAAGQSKDVEVTNWMAQYERRVSILGQERRAAVFSAYSTPKVDVLGKTFNPIDDYDNRQLVELMQRQYGSISDVQPVSNQTVTVLGHDATVSKFSAKAQLDGTSVDVYIHVTKVKDGDDIVVAVGVYPQQLDGEEDHILTLMQHLDHES